MNILQKTSFIIFIILCGCQKNLKEETISYSEPIIIEEKNIIESSFIIERYENKFDWSKIEIEINETEKARLINILKPHFDYFLESEYYKNIFNSKIHFVDINNDDKIDVIFNGWSGGESDITRFFIQSENKFEKWFEVFQNPLKIKIIDNSIKEIIAINNGCCDAYQVTISKYKITDKLNLKSQISYINWTIMDGINLKPTEFEIINEKYFVRDSPKIDNETVNERFESKGNIIGELTKGQKGVAYKFKTDSTGRKWWLVETEPLDSLKNSLFYKENKIKTKYIGWISSRYVKKINN